MDSGAADHVASRAMLPKGAIDMSRPIKNFTAANGTTIKGEGQALVQMTQSELPDSPVLAGFHSADG